jgi:hypothetical protein
LVILPLTPVCWVLVFFFSNNYPVFFNENIWFFLALSYKKTTVVVWVVVAFLKEKDFFPLNNNNYPDNYPRIFI